MFELVAYVTERYLCGELRTDTPLPVRFHVTAKDEHFFREGETVYRNNRIVRRKVDARTGNLLEETVIKENHARVLYDTDGLPIGKCISKEG